MRVWYVMHKELKHFKHGYVFSVFMHLLAVGNTRESMTSFSLCSTNAGEIQWTGDFMFPQAHAAVNGSGFHFKNETGNEMLTNNTFLQWE